MQLECVSGRAQGERAPWSPPALLSSHHWQPPEHKRNETQNASGMAAGGSFHKQPSEQQLLRGCCGADSSLDKDGETRRSIDNTWVCEEMCERENCKVKEGRLKLRSEDLRPVMTEWRCYL